jgi:hypothetical protein
VPVGRYRRIIGARARVLYKDFFGPAKQIMGAPREVVVMIAKDATGAAPTRDGQPVPVATAANTTANGLIAGQYVAPVGEFIFPENTGFGDPVLAANFECLRFLRPGLTPANGRIDPWPASVLPTGVACGPDPK